MLKEFPPPRLTNMSRMFINKLVCSMLIMVMSAPVMAMNGLPPQNKESETTWEQYVFYSFFTGIILIWLADRVFTDEASDVQRSLYSEADSSSCSLRYILNQEEQADFIKMKDESARQKFAENYWKKFDPYRPDSLNELREEFEERIHLANLKFRMPEKRGWRTDRGRIWIIYGQPQEIIMAPMSTSLLSDPKNASSLGDFEIWYYDKTKGKSEVPSELAGLDNGRMFFLFSRESGNAEYVQIFSTELGEMVDARFHY